MRRRHVLALLTGTTLAAVALARAQTRVPRIGILGPADASVTWWVDGFRAGLAELGHVEGKTVLLEARFAQGRFDLLPGLAHELAQLPVDVLVAFATQASLAAKSATQTIPIVMVGVADPLSVGLVDSLARPGGNITGTAGMSAEFVGKQIELIMEADPQLSRVAVLSNPANSAFQTLQLREAEEAGRRAGVQLDLFVASAPDAIDAAFAAIARADIQALLILSDPLFSLHREQLVSLASRNRLLTVSGFRGFAEAGGVMAYGPDYFARSKRAAAYVDRILRGTKPAEMPIEQSSHLELIVNLRAARLAGIAIPTSILARADEVIE